MSLWQWLTLGLAWILGSVLGGCSPSYPEVELDLGESEGPRHSPARPSGKTFRFSVAAMQSPESTFESYAHLFERVGQLLGVDVSLVQRRTYREVDDLLIDRRLDAALVCTGGYLDLLRRAPTSTDVVAVPVIGGKTTYESLLIVPASSTARSVEDLAGRRFAFTDELSLSGRLYPLRYLRSKGKEPAQFFGSTFYTHSHERSLDALVGGLADGIAVDSLVYAYRASADPQLAERTRIIHRSPPLGMPPVVVSTAVPAPTRARLREVLLSLHRDEQAAVMLRSIRVERFVAPPEGLYDFAATIAEGAP